MPPPRPFRLLLLLASAAACLAAAPLPARQSDDALSTAHAMHLRLLALPVSQRSAAGYEAIVAVLQPVWTDSKDPNADSARFEAGSVYVAMARDLDDSAGYTKAAQEFLGLLHASPYTAYRRNAEWALAQIQIFHLHQPRAAAVWLRDFQQRYPADPRAEMAHLEARGQKVPEPDYLELNKPLPSVPATVPPGTVAALPENAPLPPSAPVPGPAHPSLAAAPAATPRTHPDRSHQLPVHIGNVDGIQVFSGAASTSVVVGLRAAVPFHRGAVPGHHLVYFDISSQGAPHHPRASASVLAVNDGRVLRVRVAEYSATITRVVIETAGGAATADRGRLFPNPERLIVGIAGNTTPASQPVAQARPAAPLSAGGSSLTRALGLKIGRIVLDAGHGGHDTGTVGLDGLLEKDVVLDVTQRLGRLLQTRMGVSIVYTRDSDVFIPLEERTAIANRAQADLFVSIHANSSPDAAARGVETYYLDMTNNAQALAVAARENAGSGLAVHDLKNLVRTITLNDKMRESQELARDLEHSLAQASGEEDRGVKTAPFVVLIGAQMPSVLAEISFLSNRSDDRQLQQSAYRQRLAEALYGGIRRYMQSLGGNQTVTASLIR